MFDAESGTLMAEQGSGDIGAQIKAMGYTVDADDGIVGYVTMLREPFMTNSVLE